MKTLFYILSFITLVACTKDEVVDELGIQSQLKGHVEDNIRGVNIKDYKIKLVKSWRSCSNWSCGLVLQEIGTTYTDVNGDYLIKFKYKLKEGETYAIEEQYYGYPYFPEYIQNGNSGIKAGQESILNINAWKPIILRLNLNVTNNTFAPLHARNEIENSNNSFLNTENIYEQNIIKTYDLHSKPNSDIKIIFWYYSGTNPVQTLHQKIILYHTTIDDVNILNYNIDCSTF